MAAIQASSRRLTAEQRRQQLVAVALELFAQRGYRATTMDDIAEGGTDDSDDEALAQNVAVVPLDEGLATR